MTPYYEHNGVRLYHNNCLDVLPFVGPVDLVLTDPPYARSGNRGEWKVTASVTVGLYQVARLVKKGGAMLVFTTTSGRGIEFTLATVGDRLPFTRLLVWQKDAKHSRVAGPWNWDAVSILAFGRACFGPAGRSSVLTTFTTHKTEHPGELPYDIAPWLYDPFDREGLTVLDPFMGTGQLLVPAAQAGRTVIGIEIEERWCEIAANRLEGALI